MKSVPEIRAVWALAGRAVREGSDGSRKGHGRSYGGTRTRRRNAWMSVCICVSFEYSTPVLRMKYRRGVLLAFCLVMQVFGDQGFGGIVGAAVCRCNCRY